MPERASTSAWATPEETAAWTPASQPFRLPSGRADGFDDHGLPMRGKTRTCSRLAQAFPKLVRRVRISRTCYRDPRDQRQPDSPDLPAGFDPTDPELNEAGVPHEEFLELRKHGAGLVGRAAAGGARRLRGRTASGRSASHADVAAVSKNSKDFST